VPVGPCDREGNVHRPRFAVAQKYVFFLASFYNGFVINELARNRGRGQRLFRNAGLRLLPDKFTCF
jgi:hypothetical protein